MLGARLCLGCALRQQNSFPWTSLILSAHLQSKCHHYLLLSFHDCLLHQCHPLPPLPTNFGEQKRMVSNGDTFTLLCSLSRDSFRQGLSKEPPLANDPHPSRLGAPQEEAVTPQTLQPADVCQAVHLSCCPSWPRGAANWSESLVRPLLN